MINIQLLAGYKNNPKGNKYSNTQVSKKKKKKAILS